ncbi:hypothetical protein SFRURICE_004458 [Spodoptera frugiperda]|uniref:SFRICE_010754 n=1 Tax=Spodoptera frugiperda TaxID=7108 RepID=A0A2H1WB02_SPOFR|nr:hypothetical protein SFRURICE_004458 [Spodoptera frugiperda]
MFLLYIASFCSCDEPELKSNNNDDTFPSSDQIWGMIGTILATVACWIVYTKVRIGRKRCHNHHTIMHTKPRTGNVRRGHVM